MSEPEIKFSKEVNEIGEKIEKWNVGQISELIEWMEKKFNIQNQTVVQTASPAQNEEKTEEKSGNVSVKWVGMKEEGLSIIAVLGVIKDAIKELKDEEKTIIQVRNLTKEGNKIILENVPRDKIEGEKGVKKRLEEKGAEVEIVEIK